MNKEQLESYCQAIIDLNDLAPELNVRVNVYHIDLSDSLELNLLWDTGYDNAKDEMVTEIKRFDHTDKNFVYNFHNFIEENLNNEKFDSDYDSRQAEKEFREEMRFEYSRGN